MRILFVALAAVLSATLLSCSSDDSANNANSNANMQTAATNTTNTTSTTSTASSAEAESAGTKTYGSAERVEERARASSEASSEASRRATAPMSNAQLESHVRERFERAGLTDIKVAANDGKATLTGTVDSDKKRGQAELIAKYTDGVTSVRNEIVVREPPSKEPAYREGRRALLVPGTRRVAEAERVGQASPGVNYSINTNKPGGPRRQPQAINTNKPGAPRDKP